MKKLLAIGLALASLSLGAAQCEVVDGVTWYYEEETSWEYVGEQWVEMPVSSTIVKGANAYAGDLVMPATLGGRPVTRIGSSSFKDCGLLTSLVIPNTVEYVDCDAFWNCTGLRSLTIPDSVVSMSSWVFEDCSALESVVLPIGLTRIEYSLFSGCTALKSVTIPSGVTEIADYAFRGCTSLESVVFPSLLESIGSYAFSGCDRLRTVAIPPLVNTIGDGAFNGCKSIESWTVDPDNVSYKVVNGCLVSHAGTTLVGVPCGVRELTVPDGVGALPASVFCGNTNLVSVVIPGSVRTIGYETFRDCTALETVILGEGVAILGPSAFYHCTALRTIALPSTLVSVGEYCFYDCEKLSAVELADSIKTIAYGAFERCKSLETLSIPASLTSLESYAFYGCEKLASPIVIPEGISDIPYECFGGCASLRTVTLPSTLRTISDYAFYNCKKLERADIPDGVTSIGYGAFEYCESLIGVRLPAGLTSIGEWSFYGCEKITSIDIPDGVTRIERYAFCECSLSGEITIPASVVYLGEYAFGYSWSDNVISCVNFLGAPPDGVADSGLLSADKKNFRREYGAAWQAVVGLDGFTGFEQPDRPFVTVVSASIRPEDPTVMDVVYKVTSVKPTVKVRALAFEDGVRSFAKVIRPENFIENTAGNVGDAIAANVEHKLTWKVSSDWKTDLARVKFEVLAVEDNLLPFELVTIPANLSFAKLQASWNVISESQYLDALFWLYADKDAGMTLADGVLAKTDTGATLAEGTAVSPQDGYYSWYDGDGNYRYISNGASAPRYVFEKMGFRLLEGDELAYVKDETRYDLNPEGFRQYAVREVR